MDLAKLLKSLGAKPAEEEPDSAAEKLSKVSPGDFDRTYLKEQAEGHEKLLHVQNDFLGASQNRLFVTVANLVRGRVQEHLDLIGTIRDQLRT